MHFYDIKQLYKKIEKFYDNGDIFRSYIENSSLFPLVISLKKVQQKDIQNNYALFSKELHSLQKTPLPLLYKEFDFKTLGRQKLPISIEIETLDQFLSLVDKAKEYKNFTLLYAMIIQKYPALQVLFFKKPFFVLEYAREWEKFFLILDFFLDNRQQNLYIREIGLEEIDTKYIQKHIKILDTLLSCIMQTDPLKSLREYAFEKKYCLKYPLPQIRFRILDKNLFIASLSDITLNIDEFVKLDIACKEVFIVENKMTTLAFPNTKESIVIFGSGYKVGALKDVAWLQEKKVYYWGDIDAEGFAILSQIRGYFANIQSLCMDEKTLQTFKHFVVEDEKATFKELQHLTPQERKLYKKLNNRRLEQERIPFTWFLQIIDKGRKNV